MPRRTRTPPPKNDAADQPAAITLRPEELFIITFYRACPPATKELFQRVAGAMAEEARQSWTH